jgi:hypothetical protein
MQISMGFAPPLEIPGDPSRGFRVFCVSVLDDDCFGDRGALSFPSLKKAELSANL